MNQWTNLKPLAERLRELRQSLVDAQKAALEQGQRQIAAAIEAAKTMDEKGNANG